MQRFGFILIFLLAAEACAGVHDDVGFAMLKAELGHDLPTGTGVSVAQVESSMDVDSGVGAEKIRTWMPDTQARGLRPYKFVDRSGAPGGVHSGHATSVARRIIGRARDQGMASEIDLYEVYSVQHWLGAGMLHGRTDLAPRAGPLRVVNHSWAASGRESRILRRSDWLTDRDEVIQVVGVRNAAGKVNTPLLAAAVNAIVVGRSDGQHSVGTPPVSDIYLAGRTRPHLVAPLKYGSAAAPTVTSAVIILLQTASNPVLSTRRRPIDNRGGQPIYDAGRSEVIRAVLMAGADRETDNGIHADITSYRDTPAHRAGNGLDTRFGAGQLNVYSAWHILDAGEQEEDIGACGFDYEPGLDRDGSKRYVVPELSSAARLTATLSWNLLFPYGSETRFDGSAVLNDLDLSLYEISGDQRHLVQGAHSRIDTTETIDAVLTPGKRFELLVSRVDRGSVTQDYAIAWHMAGDGPSRCRSAQTAGNESNDRACCPVENGSEGS